MNNNYENENDNVNVNVNEEEIEYTLVMDGNFAELVVAGEGGLNEEAISADRKRTIDELYNEYEQMCFQDPTILDTDDAYPHTYQWRIGDKYDTAKVEVIAAALKEHRRITDTKAYEKYIEEISKSNFKPDSWD